MRSERMCRVISLTTVLCAASVAGQAQVLSPNLLFNSLQPCRLIDTRLAGGALTPGSTRTFNAVGIQAAGSLASQGGNPNGCPVPGFGGFSGPGTPPARVQALLLNVVAVGPAGAGDLQAWPTGLPIPNASIVNYSSLPGLNIANAVVVPVRQDHQGADITLRAQSSATHVVADVLGYFSAETDAANENLFLGALAGISNAGAFNTGLGDSALFQNGTGFNSTAVGAASLWSNTTGSNNTGVGLSTLFWSAAGNENTAVGSMAVADLATGSDNTGVGYLAIGGLVNNNTNTGDDNTGVGSLVLGHLAAGSNNVALGFNAGVTLATGSNNLYLASDAASSSESGSIRIGTTGTHTSAAMAGISGVTSSAGVPVLVNSAGKLGTTTSSRRFKEGIEDLGDESRGLMRLRPVSFFYRPEYDDGSHRRQYGLIAEEVAAVYPDLVVYDKEGQPQTVRYQLLDPMLLNELQRQGRQLGEQGARAAEQERSLAAAKRQIAGQARTLAEQAGLLQSLAARLSELEGRSRGAASALP
jgi:hypothetical protein